MKIRAWHRKSRRGCLTCKKRHLKCDETQPECLRCFRSARQCLPYETPAEGSGPGSHKELNFIHYDPQVIKPPSPKRESSALSLNIIDSERHLVAFFTHITVPLLAQCFHGDVWRNINTISLLSNPAFKDVAIACASHHMSFVRRNSAGNTLLDDTRLLRQYCRALRAHQDLIVHGTNDNAGAIVATILLVILESLRRKTNALKMHLIGGLRLLKTNHYGLDNNLRLQLLQVYIASSLSAIMHSPDAAIRVEIESMSLDDYCLQLLVDDDYNYLRAVSEYVVVQTYCYILRNTLGTFDSESHKVAKRNDIVEKLDLVRRLLASAEHDGRAKQLMTCNLIHARILLCDIFLSASSSPTQSKFDEYEDSFRRIVTLLSEVLQQQPQKQLTPEWPSSFSIGFGLIPVLQLTVQQCRNPQIRRDALKLLNLCPRREDLWDADDSRHIGEAVIAFEEAGAQTGRGVSLIPEEKRIHFALLDQISNRNSQEILYVLCGPLQISSSNPLIELPLR